MKKCVYCGTEYDDAASACALDGQPLTHVPQETKTEPATPPAELKSLKRGGLFGYHYFVMSPKGEERKYKFEQLMAAVRSGEVGRDWPVRGEDESIRRPVTSVLFDDKGQPKQAPSAGLTIGAVACVVAGFALFLRLFVRSNTLAIGLFSTALLLFGGLLGVYALLRRDGRGPAIIAIALPLLFIILVLMQGQHR